MELYSILAFSQFAITPDCEKKVTPSLNFAHLQLTIHKKRLYIFILFYSSLSVGKIVLFTAENEILCHRNFHI